MLGNIGIIDKNINIKIFINKVISFFKGEKQIICMSLLIRQILLFDHLMKDDKLRVVALLDSKQEEDDHLIEMIKNLGNLCNDEVQLLSDKLNDEDLLI